MPCGSCGAGADGKSAECRSNGSCGNGGCNRLNVYDWLADIPQSDQTTPFDIVEISFNHGSRKDFFKNTTHQQFRQGTLVAVEGVGGFDVGEVYLSVELVRFELLKQRVKDT